MSKKQWDKAQLEDLYWKQGMSIREVAEYLDQTHMTIEWAFYKFEIPRRTISQSLLLYYTKNERPTGNKAPGWRNGRRRTTAGYVEVYLFPDDFFFPMASKQNYVKEHRLVMAKYLARCLLPWEIVHHKNGIKDDNRLENLQLLPSNKQHASDMELKRRVRHQEKTIRMLRAEIAKLNCLLAAEIKH